MKLTVGNILTIIGIVLTLAGSIIGSYMALKEFDHQLERRVDRLEYMQGIVTDGDT